MRQLVLNWWGESNEKIEHSNVRYLASIVNYPKLKIRNQHHDRRFFNLNSDNVLSYQSSNLNKL